MMDRAEKIGLGVATAGHVLLFGLLSTAFLSAPDPLKLHSPPMDISMVDEVALRSTAPRISTTPPPPSEAPEKGPAAEAAPDSPAPPEPKAAPPEPAPPEPAPSVKPAPAPPKPLPATKPVARAKPKPAALPKPTLAKPTPAKSTPARATPAKPSPAKAATAKPAAKATSAKPRAPLKLALDKPDAAGQGKAAQSRGSKLGPNFLKGIDSDTPASRPSAAPAASAIGPAQKAALDAEIRRQIKPYWKAPTGADAEQLRTVVQVELNKDGSIADGPDIVQTTGTTDANRTQVKLHQELAIKAIKLAAPFRLPADLYDGWKSLRISLDKRLSQ